MLPFFFRHYDRFIAHYYIRDNQSDDGSLEILSSHARVTILPLVLEGDSICEAAFAQVNSFWRPSRGQADWAAVCNIDELFWHHDMIGYLAECKDKGITFLSSTGYQMVSEHFPNPNSDLPKTHRWGARDTDYDKPAFFNPNAITDSGFSIGRHACLPQGRVILAPQDEIILLHYKHLGQDYLVERHRQLNERRRRLDIERRLGFQYDPHETLRRHERFMAEAQEVIPARSLWDSFCRLFQKLKRK